MVMKTKWLMLSLIFAAIVSRAADVRVSGGGNALQKAVDRAKTGDVLLVEPGTYSAFDTQGKEIEIRSTKGPKQTFVAGSYLKKGYFSDPSTIVVFGVPDAFAKGIAEGASVPSGAELVRKVSKTKVVGFTFDFAKTATSPRSHIVGGHIVGCILKNTSTLFSVVESSLIVNTDYSKVVCTDSRLVNCTVVVGTHITGEEALFCCELFNTIVYDVNRGTASPVVIGWNGATRPQMENSLFCDGIFWDCADGVVDDPRMLRTDPGFVDAASGDYWLVADSPCIDAGNIAYSTADLDLNGCSRIANGRIDIGAYEYGSTPPDGEEAEPTELDPVYGPFTPGEKVALEVSALVGYTAKGLPSGLKLDKKTGAISGTPKKPTGNDGVTVTFTKKDAPTLTTKFVVGPIPTISVTLEGDTQKCKVSGANKAYLVGKKVSLMAKGPKGTAFVGWFKDGEPWPSAETYLTAKISYVMTAENLDLVACFEKEKMSIDASSLEGAFFEAGTVVAQGEIVIDVETQSGLKSLKAAKLPSGLKLAQDRKTGEWSVFGTPKKAGTSVVTLTATAKSGAVETKTVDVVVSVAGGSEGDMPEGSLPSWAVGTFEGYDHDLSSNYDWEGGWEDEWLIKTQMTISPSGKVSVRRASCTISKAMTGQVVSCDGTICRIAFADDQEMTLQLARLEADGCEWGRVTCTWRHINEWNEHIESTLALWQVRWKDFSGSAVAPVFAKNTQTTISMEEWLINGETSANPSCHGGFLTLKYGDAGVLTVSFSETSGGTATATSSAQMVPTELDKNGRLHLLATMILKPKNRVPFSLVLWLSVPAGAGQVSGNDVVVEDYLLCHD